MEIQHKRNTAYYHSFPMLDSADNNLFKSGLTVAIDAYYKDGASAWATLSVAGSVSEIVSTGMYKLDLLGSELNHDLVIIKFTSAGASDTMYRFNMSSNEYVADSVWDEAFSGHSTAGTFGKLVKNLGEGVVSIDGAVNDVGATVNTFVTNLAETTDSHYADLTLIFTSGNLKGQAKPIQSYNGTTKTIVLDEDLTEAPADTDEFLILAIHIHPVTQIATGVRTEIDSNSTQLSGIKAVTDAIPDSGALTTLSSNVSDILTDTGATIPAQIAGLNDISAATVNAQCDQAITDAALATSANLGVVDGVVDAIRAVTDNLPDSGALTALLASVSDILTDTGTTIPAQIAGLNNISANDILTTQFTESYAAAGVSPTLVQAVLMILQRLGEHSISGTTMTVKKLDGIASAGTYDLNDAASPTSINRNS